MYSVGAVLAVASATSGVPATVLAAGVVTMALIAHRAPGTAREAEPGTRTAQRAELVTAVDAWTEWHRSAPRNSSQHVRRRSPNDSTPGGKRPVGAGSAPR